MAAARTTVRTRVPARPGIRWDRLGRIALLCVLGLVLYLYVAPTKAWFAKYGEAERKRAEVAALKDRNDDLRRRKDALRRESTLEREARRLGMVREGEKAFVVQGLPGG
jgi:cell division protein FtsB